jgi:hypothetical protein
VEKLGAHELRPYIAELRLGWKMGLDLYPFRCLKNSTWRKRFSASALLL